MSDVLKAYEAAVARRESSELEDQLAAELRRQRALWGNIGPDTFATWVRDRELERDKARKEVDALRSLPVLRTCGGCSEHGLDHAGEGRCYHDAIDGTLVDLDAAPPDWCPLRGTST